ncbi:hypothetical protein BGX27_007994 [Mortierella sp. AM989]|nr:hypothetical protein BGX27_007994 [Mortierella sp. AM989]
MSTFDGLIREFPTVAIDNFKIRPGVNIYLLSHVHSDHLTGLTTKTWSSPIYCSQITAKWLPMLATRSKQSAFESGQDKVLQCKYSHLAPFLKPLATDVPHYLDLGNGRQVRLSLIPAHHCPGAVMFLLQDDRSCVLYTGDARNESLDLQGLGNMPIFSSSTQDIDRLYLDTTYCHQEFIEFPSREFVISDLITFINRRPRLAHYYIDAWTFGYEDIWIALSKAFNTKIHVSPYHYELYKAIDDMISPKILPHLTLDGTTARFHSCRLGSTCGYGGAGGEHSSARELIRIQPNVVYFSAMVRNARNQTETAMAQGKVVRRSNSFKTKEKLPPSIAKKDDLCYYINYSFHASLSELRQLVKIVSPRTLFPCVLHRDGIFNTLYSSNREVVALLAQGLPDRTFSTDVEEYSDRRPCISDGITTDFQSFHHAKGFNILDMNDKVLGITPKVAGPNFKPLEKAIVSEDQGCLSSSNSTAAKALGLALSPRSKHLLKKMEKLKRQLRSTASLEEEGVHIEDEDSMLNDGPLSLDLEAIERKRKWWLEYERGKSTTQEDITTGEEETDPQISRILSSEPTNSPLQVGEGNNHTITIAGEECIHDSQAGPKVKEEWYELSTLELNPPMLILEEEKTPIHWRQSEDKSDDPNSTSDRTRFLSSSPDPISSLESEGTYASYLNTSSAASIPSPDASFHSPLPPFSSPSTQTNPEIEAAVKDENAEALSLPSHKTQMQSEPEHTSIPDDDPPLPLSYASLSHHITSSLSTTPKTPPRPKDFEVDLGQSPSSCRSSAKRLAPSFIIQEPIGNIFAQLAWSPPLRPIKKPMRAHTEPFYSADKGSILQPLAGSATKRAASSIVSREVIIIESSDEDDDNDLLKVQVSRRTKKMKGAREAETVSGEKNNPVRENSQDVNLLEYQELEFDGSNSFML